jgi:hypothetical protein
MDAKTGLCERKHVGFKSYILQAEGKFQGAGRPGHRKEDALRPQKDGTAAQTT